MREYGLLFSVQNRIEDSVTPTAHLGRWYPNSNFNLEYMYPP